MCSLTLGLMGASMAMNAYGQYEQGKAQAAAYNAQAEAAEQNAAIEARKREQVADSYAQQQRKLTDRMRLVRGQVNAAAGAAGLMGGTGSTADLLASSEDAFERDTNNLLTNQRNDSWSGYVNQVNYLNQANAARASAYNAKQQGKMGAIGTILGGAASFFGGGGSSKDTTTDNSGWYDMSTKNVLNSGNAYANVGQYGFDLATGNYIGTNPYSTKKKSGFNLGVPGLQYR